MVKLGIIGCGNIARFHFEGIRRCGATVAYVCDVNAQAAQPYADEFGAAYTADYKEIINSDVDAVAVLTSGKYHRDICEAAIQAGKHIICEKTMMDNAEDAAYIANLAKEKGVIFFTAFMKRYFPAAQKAKELMARLGTIFSAQVRSFQGWGDLYDSVQAKDWQWAVDNYGGAVVKCAGSHMLDMMMYLLGRPQRVYADIDYIPGSQIDRRATALFTYDTFSVNFETAAHPLKKIGYERNSWDEYVKICGTKGTLAFYTVMWDHPENNAALLEYYDDEQQTVTQYRFDIVNPFVEQTKYMVACIESGRHASPDMTDGANVDIVIQAMFEAAQKKQSIVIDYRGL